MRVALAPLVRRRGRAWLALAVVVGVAWGAGMTLVAGARRTDTALARYSRATGAADVYVGTGVFVPGRVRLSAVERLPQVAAAARIAVPLLLGGRTNAGTPIGYGELETIVPAGRRYGRVVDRPKLLSGRAARPARADEVVIGSHAAVRLHIGVGGALSLRFATHAGLARIVAGRVAPDPRDARLGPLLHFRVVGVAADVRSQSFQPRVFFTHALLDVDHGRLARAFSLTALRLRRGEADVPALQRTVQRMARGRSVSIDRREEMVRDLAGSFHAQAEATGVTAAAALFAALLLAIQVVSRQVELDAADAPVLAALGMGPEQVLGVALVPAMAIGAGAALIAAAVAVAASPLMPIGAARVAEPRPGLAVDHVVVVAGAVAAAVVAVLSGMARALAGARAPVGLLGQTREPAAGRGSPIARALAGAGLPPHVLIGMRMALERGRGRGAVPVRAITVALAVAIAAVAAILSFRAGLDHLTRTPRLYGQTYDAWGATEPAPERALARLTHDRTISAVSAVTLTNAVVAGQSATLMAIEPRKGSIPLAMTAGRAPEADHETALGTRTMADAGVRIGDVVRIDAGLGARRMRVVGRAVLPNTSGPSGAVRPAEGALVTVPGLRAVGSQERPSRALLRFAPGEDRRAELFHLGTDFAPPVTPVDIENFSRVEQAPLAMAVLFALASAAALTHALMLSGRRRRRELALLKTLGLAPRQVAGAITWQAVTMVVVALAAGLPLGVAGGRLAWYLFADRAGFVAEAVTPWFGIVLLCPVALSFSLVVALIPAISAARIWPAPALRTE